MSEDIKEVMLPNNLKTKKVFFQEYEKPKVWIMALSFKRETIFLWPGNPNVGKKPFCNSHSESQ